VEAQVCRSSAYAMANFGAVVCRASANARKVIIVVFLATIYTFHCFNSIMHFKTIDNIAFVHSYSVT